MLAVAFDTLKLARRLESAGFPPKQAQEASAALAESMAEGHAASDLATRYDVQAVAADVQKVAADMRETEARLLLKIAELNSRVAETNGRIAESKADVIKWVVGIAFAQAAMIVGMLKLHW